MNKLLLAGVAVCAVALVAVAHAELSPLMGVYNADNVDLYAGKMVYPNGKFHPMGVLYTTTATKGTTTGTGEEVLATYSLPANALDAVGRRIRACTSWHMASNGNNKTIKLYFGASVITSGTLTDNNVNGVACIDVVKTGASTQIVTGTMLHDTTNITPYINAGSDTDTSAIVIKMTGQDGSASANDIVMEDFYVQYMN